VLSGLRTTFSVSRARDIPHPKSERESWKEELAGLPDQIANHPRELAATPVGDKERRENLLWRIRRDQLRIADLEKRLQEERGTSRLATA